MKAAAIICPVLVAWMIQAADPTPPEIATARARYEAALSAASMPLRTKYLAELEQIKNRAISAKNLPLAMAADEEIKALGASVSIGDGTGKSLHGRLVNTTWTWGTNKSVTFLPNGKADVDNFATYTWDIQKAPEPTVEVKWTYAGEKRSVKYTFSQDLKSAKAVMDWGARNEWDSRPVEKK